MMDAGAAIIGVPSDHLLLAAIIVAFIVTTGLQEANLTLIVPMRDGYGESDVVANLATTRHLTLRVQGRSFLGIAMDVSTRLRRREWGFSDPLTDSGDRLLVNIRGIPRLKGARTINEPVDTKRSTTRYVRNLMEMFVDQETDSRWTISMGIRNDLSGKVFASALRHALKSFASDPLVIAGTSQPLMLETALDDRESISVESTREGDKSGPDAVPLNVIDMV